MKIMKSTRIKQVVTRNLSQISPQQSYKTLLSTQVASQHVKCVNRMTFSQKLYQAKETEVAEDNLQTLNADSLEKIKKSLSKLVGVSESISDTQVISPQIKCISRMTFSQKLYQAKKIEIAGERYT